MTSEVVDKTTCSLPVDTAALIALFYLQRNDFDHLVRVEDRLISAKDGTRDVLVWIDIGEPPRTGGYVCASLAADRARDAGARLDVLRVLVGADGRVHLSLLMNALEGG